MRLSTILLLFTAQLALAAPTTDSASPDFAQKADEYLKAELKAERFAGSVMVARSNQIVFMKGYGLANRELDVANAPNTKFRLASVTKQFTALCILILQEQGKLSVEDPISKFLPDCPSRLVENQDPAPAHPHFGHSRLHQVSRLPFDRDAALLRRKR